MRLDEGALVKLVAAFKASAGESWAVSAYVYEGSMSLNGRNGCGEIAFSIDRVARF